MSLFDGSWPRGDGANLRRRARRAADVPLRAEASLVLYLVSPDYALRAGRRVRVHARRRGGSKRDGLPACSSPRPSQAGENTYRTVGTSRAVALATTAPDARAGARARRRGAPRRSACSSGAATSATSYLEGLSGCARSCSRRRVALPDAADGLRARMAAVIVETLHPPAVRLQHLPRRRRRGRPGVLHRRRRTGRAADRGRRAARARRRRTCCSPTITTTTSARSTSCASAGRSSRC